ncbi:oligo-1,6-glucosidase [Chitinophaga sp. YR627]|uniref:glycoside hydrolase family 13 protein n=1 Tax=Chitinophaga sp. YR627 TaxID=1881041 RepID=UPI0008F08A07|nr:alpha-glucosidase [Chitinophaga sp. YR627]SFN21203.1 oligo-1,6-glucosidase [Chitinophaga sp. YR627]
MSSKVKDTNWWKESIIYQIYPWSFKDSNGDGIGDLQGIISKLDYIQSLGVDMVWLNPIYKSPNDDNGYDISDYYDIMKEVGTMDDFDALLHGLHDRKIRLMMDIVVNHTSDEHPWFQEAKQSRQSPYYNYYHWWPAEKGKPPRRYSHFDATGSAWTYNKATDSYYLHYFSEKMPDLNWENSETRKAIYAIMNFWFDKGVDGFRMDAICYISKDTQWPDVEKLVAEKYQHDWAGYYAHGPHLHEYLQEMHRETLNRPDVTTLAEASGITKEEALDFVKEDRKELHMLYHFEGVQLGFAKEGYKRLDPKGLDLRQLKQLYTEWDRIFELDGWGTIYLGNHDQPRMVTRWGNDDEQFREISSKMLITFLLTMRATPIFYYGDELGMTNIRFEKIEDYRDIETINMYKYIQSQGGDVAHFLKDAALTGRDNGRTPFQWDESPNAGFTTGKPWLKINENYKLINAAQQDRDERSILQYFRQLVLLRKHKPVLIHGKYELLDADHPQVYTYTRTLDQEKMLIVLNFSKEEVLYTLPFVLDIGTEPLVNNMLSFKLENDTVTLAPYQALVFGPLPTDLPPLQDEEQAFAEDLPLEKIKEENSSLESNELAI